MSAPRLEGQLTCLRPFVVADEGAFVSQATYPEMFEFTKFRYTSAKEAADGFAWLMNLAREPDVRGRVFWAIETTDDEAFAGWAGVEQGKPEDGDEFGWYLLPPYWGRGLATDATLILLRFGAEFLQSSRMVATCDPDNIGSKRVLEKAGLVSEGLLAEPVTTWRGLRPRLMYATPKRDAD